MQNEGYVQTNSELPFKYELGRDDAGKLVFISGKMDAIHEKIQDGVCQSLIEDYKTGKCKSELSKMAFQSMMIQLPLYVHIYEANKKISSSEQIDVSFRYAYLGEKEKDKDKIKFKSLNQNTPIKLADKTEIPAFTLMGDNLAKKVLEEVGAIRKGLISLTPYHPNYNSPDEIVGSASPCYSYCSMRNVCRTSEGVLKSRG